MKLFAKITSWVLIGCGLLAVLLGIFFGVVGLFARIAVSRASGRGLIGAVNASFSIIFWTGLFAGLILVALGIIIALLLEMLRMQKNSAMPAALHPAPPIIIPEKVPEINQVEPEKPPRSRKVAGK